MFFHFQLNPITDIQPWGKKDEPVLHWFGLSDGRYWIQIGATEIFRYSTATLAAYPSQDPALATHALDAYLDYYVVRLWEDILEIMPTILDPLPAPLMQRLEPIDTWLQWCQKATIWQDDPQERCGEETLDARRDMYNQALHWWWDRTLYTGPIRFDPGIRFWSDGQFVHCLWDSRDTRSSHLDNQDIWEAVYGTAVMTITTFMEAIISFNTRFISAMAERVHTIQTSWSRPEIKIDLDQLACEHVQRSEHFAQRMSEIPQRAKTAADWEHALAAIKAIENDPDFIALP